MDLKKVLMGITVILLLAVIVAFLMKRKVDDPQINSDYPIPQSNAQLESDYERIAEELRHPKPLSEISLDINPQGASPPIFPIQ